MLHNVKSEIFWALKSATQVGNELEWEKEREREKNQEREREREKNQERQGAR